MEGETRGKGNWSSLDLVGIGVGAPVLKRKSKNCYLKFQKKLK
jgi:hypothetical protein